MPAVADRTITYLLPAFPVLSESFVAAEVARLTRLGVPLRIVVLDRSQQADPRMAAALEALGARPRYLMDSPLRLLGRAARFVIRHPAAAARTVRANRTSPVFDGSSRAVRLLKALSTMQLARAEGWRHVHAHWTLPCDVGLMLARIRGLSFSFSAHAVDIYDDPSLGDEALAEWGLPGKIRTARFVATCTGRNEQVLGNLVPPESHKVNLVYHGVDLDVFDGRKTDAGGPPVILSVGRLVPKKGFLGLIETCATLARERLDFQCVIVGDGPQRSELEDAIRASGLEGRVHLTGGLPQEEVRDWLRRAAVFVLCPDAEQGHYGIPNVLFEALAMRTAAVCRELPGLGELLRDGENGLVVRELDELAPALRRLLEDPEARLRLGEAGRRTVEDGFDADRTAQALRDLLAAAADAPPSRS